MCQVVSLALAPKMAPSKLFEPTQPANSLSPDNGEEEAIGRNALLENLHRTLLRIGKFAGPPKHLAGLHIGGEQRAEAIAVEPLLIGRGTMADKSTCRSACRFADRSRLRLAAERYLPSRLVGGGQIPFLADGCVGRYYVSCRCRHGLRLRGCGRSLATSESAKSAAFVSRPPNVIV